MHADQGKHDESSPENSPVSPIPITLPAIIAYNLDDSETPGGLKVRFKVRIVTGAKAQRYDARQAQAIKELLAWSRQHPQARP